MLEAPVAGERVADSIEVAADQSDHVAGKGLFQRRPLLCHHAVGPRQTNFLPQTMVAHDQIRFIAPRADADEGDAIAVPAIHVRLDLEDEGAEGSVGIAGPLIAVRQVDRARGRRRSQVDESVEERLETEVRQSRAEEGRGDLSLQEGLLAVGISRHLQQLEFPPNALRHVRAELLVETRALQRNALEVRLLRAAGRGLGEELQLGFAAIDDADEVTARPDRPVEGAGLNAEGFLDLGHEVQGIPPGHVELVDEGQDRNAAQTAHLEELARLRLDALTGIEDHDRGIRRGQRAVGVLAEVLVSGRVQDVDHAPLVGELHRGGGDRDPPLLLHPHPVRSGQAALAVLDQTGPLDQSRVEKQLLRQGGLPGVRVRDDREGPALGDLALDVGVGHGAGT